MAVLRPTGGLTASSGTPTIVGAPPQWGDDSDSSYAVLTNSRTLATSPPLDAIVTTLPAFTVGTEGLGDVWLRLQVSPESSPDLLSLTLNILGPGGDFWVYSNVGEFYFRLAADGVTREVAGSLVFGDPAALAAALALGDCVLYVDVDYVGTLPPTGPPPSVVTIYEIGWGVPTEVRVTRQFPRDDAYGLGSAPRLVPAPRGARIVGGYT